MLLVVSVVFFLLLSLNGVNGKSAGNSQADRATSRKRGTCESTECGHLHYLENSNCVNKCVSRKCYDDVFKDKELEDGEINSSMER